MIPYNGQGKYIFVSYAHKDMRRAHRIIGRLHDEGYRVWYDEYIQTGSDWRNEIARHIRDCDVFIAIVSKSYLSSNHCKIELDYAFNNDKKFFLIYLEQCSFGDDYGLEMYSANPQNLMKYKYLIEDDFYEKLLVSPLIQESKAEEDEIPITPEADRTDFEKHPSIPKNLRRILNPLFLAMTLGTIASTIGMLVLDSRLCSVLNFLLIILGLIAAFYRPIRKNELLSYWNLGMVAINLVMMYFYSMINVLFTIPLLIVGGGIALILYIDFLGDTVKRIKSSVLRCTLHLLGVYPLLYFLNRHTNMLGEMIYFICVIIIGVRLFYSVIRHGTKVSLKYESTAILIVGCAIVMALIDFYL